MLYISRCVTSQSFGVVDTDDNVETVVGAKEIEHFVDELGIVIKGAAWTDSPTRVDGFHIAPYQSPETMTGAQVKLKMLYGVDLVIYNGVIVSISVDPRKLTKSISVRLSDFATVCGTCILDWTLIDNAGYKLTLVLDDKLEGIDYRTFSTPESALGIQHEAEHIILDVHEMTNDELVELIYDSAAGVLDESDIVDDKSRSERIWAMFDEED